MNILVSACLLGVACRYDGKSKPNDAVIALMQHHQLIPVCGEIFGGLPTPRPPAERCKDQVLTRDGMDVTAQYQRGAQEVLRLAQQYNCTIAILKERSPSCGSGQIYDGTFTGTLTDGWGVTAELLRRHNIRLVGESRVSELF